MTKNDIKLGYMVELRNGEKLKLSMFKDGQGLINPMHYIGINNYKDDLTHRLYNQYDICKVFGFCHWADNDKIDDDGRELFWDRDHTVDDEECKSLTEFAKAVHTIAVDKGWWEKDPSFPEIIAMCHCELSEALEAYRNGDDMLYRYDCDGDITTDMEGYKKGEKVDGIAVELADCILRILDYCAVKQIDIDAILTMKNAYNKTRDYRHGGKLI